MAETEKKRRRPQRRFLVGGGISVVTLLAVVFFIWFWTHRPPKKLPTKRPEPRDSTGSHEIISCEQHSSKTSRQRHPGIKGDSDRKEETSSDKTVRTSYKGTTRKVAPKLSEQQTRTGDLDKAEELVLDDLSGTVEDSNADTTPPQPYAPLVSHLDLQKKHVTGEIITSAPIVDPFLENSAARKKTADSPDKLFKSLKSRFLKEAMLAFTTRQPCDSEVALHELLTQSKEEISRAKAYDEGFDDPDEPIITESTLLKVFLRTYFSREMKGIVSKYDQAFRECCEKGEQNAFKDLFAAWTAWLKYLSLQTTEEPPEWVAFKDDLAKAEEWCKSLIPELPETNVAKVMPKIEVTVLDHSTPVKKRFLLRDIIFTPKECTFTYIKYCLDQRKKLLSIELFGKTYEILAEDLHKNHYVFELDCQGTLVSLEDYADPKKLPLSRSQLDAAKFNYSATLTRDYLNRYVALKFTNLDIPNPQHDIFVKPLCRQNSNRRSELDLNFIKDMNILVGKDNEYSTKKANLIKIVDPTSTSVCLKYYFESIEPWQGLDLCGWVFPRPWYVNGCKGVVLEAKVDDIMLVRPIVESIYLFDQFDWKFYEATEPGDFVIVQFVGEDLSQL